MRDYVNNPPSEVSYRGELLTTAPGAVSRSLSTRNDSSVGQIGIGVITLPIIVSAIKRQKWLVVGLGVAGLLLGLLLFLSTDPVYESTVQIELNSDTARSIETDDGNRSLAQLDRVYLSTQEQILNTHSIRLRVAQRLKLDSKPEIVSGADNSRQNLDKAARWLGQNVTAGQLPDTRIFNVSAQGHSPKLVADIANAYADEYAQMSIERQLSSNSYARDYLSEQIIKVRGELENSERALVAYASEQGIISLGSVESGTEGQSLSTASLTDLNAALTQARAQRIAAQERFRNDASGEKAEPATAIALRTQLAQLQAEYQQKREIFKPEYPEMIALQGQIDSLKQSLASATGQSQGLSRRHLASEYEAALGQERQLERQVSDLKRKAISERGSSIQYNILRREVDTNAAQYDALLERFKQLGPAGTQVENLISVVDPARVPRSPLRPLLPVNLALGLIGGLLIGLLAAIMSSLFNTRVRTPNDVDQLLGQQLIGPIPHSGAMNSERLKLDDPKEPIYEAFVSVVNRLRFITGEGIPKVFSLTSTLANEGKSTTAYGLAEILSRQGKRVLLIDADLRMPSFLGIEKDTKLIEIQKRLEQTGRRGLSDVLIGDAMVDDVVLHLREKLDLLPGGSTPPNPAELLLSQNFQSLLHERSEIYDHIIVDGPPVLGLADAPIIASLTSGTIFVLETNRATSQQIRSAIRRLEDSNGLILGVIMVRGSDAQSEDDYGYSYHYSYSPESREKSNRGALASVLEKLRR